MWKIGEGVWGEGGRKTSSLLSQCVKAGLCRTSQSIFDDLSVNIDYTR